MLAGDYMSKTQKNFRLSEETAQQLKKLATAKNCRESEIVELAIKTLANGSESDSYSDLSVLKEQLKIKDEQIKQLQISLQVAQKTTLDSFTKALEAPNKKRWWSRMFS